MTRSLFSIAWPSFISESVEPSRFVLLEDVQLILIMVHYYYWIFLELIFAYLFFNQKQSQLLVFFDKFTLIKFSLLVVTSDARQYYRNEITRYKWILYKEARFAKRMKVILLFRSMYHEWWHAFPKSWVDFDISKFGLCNF